MLCPAANGRCIGQARGILAVRRRFLQRIAGTDPLTRVLATAQRVVRRRSQPVGQDCESLPARSTHSASYPNSFALIIVGGPKPPSVSDDRVPSAKRALPRQAVEWNYPGSRLSFPSGSAIKRIKAGVKALFAELVLPKSRSANLRLHPPVKLASNEKRIPLCLPRQLLT